MDGIVKWESVSTLHNVLSFLSRACVRNYCNDKLTAGCHFPCRQFEHDLGLFDVCSQRIHSSSHAANTRTHREIYTDMHTQGSKWDGMRRYGILYRHFFGRLEIIPPHLSGRLPLPYQNAVYTGWAKKKLHTAFFTITLPTLNHFS